MSIRVSHLAVASMLAIVASLAMARAVDDEQEDPVDAMARAGAEAYALVETTGFCSAAALHRCLHNNADIVEHAVWTPEQRAALLVESAAFLWLYFGQPNPDAYMQWRRFRGYVPRYDVYRAYQSYENLFGRPLPRNQSHAQTFREFWAARLELFNGVNRPVAHAAEARGIHLVVGEVSRQNPHHIQPLRGELGIEYWHGGISYAGRPWWKLRYELEQETLLAAQLGIILEFANGSRRPILILWHYDEQSRAWRLSSMNVANTIDDGILAGEF